MAADVELVGELLEALKPTPGVPSGVEQAVLLRALEAHGFDLFAAIESLPSAD